jgi:hypothetical protein
MSSLSKLRRDGRYMTYRYDVNTACIASFAIIGDAAFSLAVSRQT